MPVDKKVDRGELFEVPMMICNSVHNIFVFVKETYMLSVFEGTYKWADPIGVERMLGIELGVSTYNSIAELLVHNIWSNELGDQLDGKKRHWILTWIP